MAKVQSWLRFQKLAAGCRVMQQLTNFFDAH